jgi:hypothetical protein
MGISASRQKTCTKGNQYLRQLEYGILRSSDGATPRRSMPGGTSAG